MIAWVLVAVAGGAGAAARFMADGAIRSRWPGRFPVATVAVNVSGSLLIGLLEGAALFHGMGSVWFLATTTGLCGGYTTFSTAMVETVRQLEDGEARPALVNAFGTLAACLAAASLGVLIMWSTAG